MPTTKTRLPFFGQNLILTFTGCSRLANIDAIQLRLQETDALRLVGIGMAWPNLISKVFAQQSFLVAHIVRLSALYDNQPINAASERRIGQITIGKEATEWPSDTIQVV